MLCTSVRYQPTDSHSYLLYSLSHPSHVKNSIPYSDEKIQLKSCARNLGVTIDQCLDLTDHVKKICVSCHYHLRNIARIRKYLSEETSAILVHAFISSKLDNCNSLLYGLPQHLLNRLRAIQNTAARIVTLSKRFDHITPIMFKLHWLPLNSRIHFKILLLMYKCLNGLAPIYLCELLRYSGAPRAPKARARGAPYLRKYGNPSM